MEVSNATIINSSFENNYARTTGGAMYTTSGSNAIFIGSNFTGNAAGTPPFFLRIFQQASIKDITFFNLFYFHIISGVEDIPCLDKLGAPTWDAGGTNTWVDICIVRIHAFRTYGLHKIVG